MISIEKKEKISYIVIKTIYKSYENIQEDYCDKTYNPFHRAFLHEAITYLNSNVTDVPFFISLSSWLHGLNTTMGQTFFENVAHILSDGSKREYTSGRSGNLYISKKQQQVITNLITDLSNGELEPNLISEDSLVQVK